MSRREQKREAKRQQLAQLEAGAAPRTKRPKVSAAPATAKKPMHLGIDHDEPFRRKPVWRFGELDMDGPPAASQLSVNDFVDLHDALGQYETQTCMEIWGQHDNGCKRYATDGAHENITQRLETLEKDDETALHTLRVNGAYRIYGILRENVFYVLWIDRQHEMWPSALRNT